MLRAIRNLFCPSCLPFGTGPLCEECTLTPVERWALKNAGKATPDGIIGAAIMESIAKHFDDWKILTLDSLGAIKEIEAFSCLKHHRISTVLTNQSKDVRFQFRTNRYGEFENGFVFVNGVRIEDKVAEAIYNAYDKIKNERKRLRDAELKAIENMKRNEAAWNLAEKLLNMKRNEFGALVPVNPVEEN